MSKAQIVIEIRGTNEGDKKIMANFTDESQCKFIGTIIDAILHAAEADVSTMDHGNMNPITAVTLSRRR